MDYSRDQLSIAGALLRIVTQRDIAEIASNFGYSQKGSEPYDGPSPRPRGASCAAPPGKGAGVC